MDFFFNPTPKQTAMSFVFALVMFGLLIVLVRVVNPAHAATPNVFAWEGSPKGTKVALIADLDSCQIFRIRTLGGGGYPDKELYVVRNNPNSARNACDITR